MKNKKIVIVSLLVIVSIFLLIKVIEEISHKKAVSVAEQFTIELCEKYNITNPKFNITTQDGQYWGKDNISNNNYFWIYINIKDERYEMLTNENKYNLINEFNNIPFNKHIVYVERINIPHLNSEHVNKYEIDFNNKRVLLLNGEEIYEYLTKEEQLHRKKIAKHQPQLKMREKDLPYTILGEPDRIEK